MDYRYDLNYMCSSDTAANIFEGVTQCFDTSLEIWMCGVDVHNYARDYSGVSIDWGTIVEFPRHVAGQQCWTPFDCMDLCIKLRERGLAPTECTYCSTPCPVDFLATVSQLVRAIYHDTYEALKITLECITGGIENCVCATALMLRPKWLDPRDLRASPKQKCYVGDPLHLLEKELVKMLSNDFTSFFGNLFKNIFNGGQPFTQPEAEGSYHDLQAQQHCESYDRYGHGSADECYYARVQQICADDGLYRKFLSLSGGQADLDSLTPSQEIQVAAKLVEGVGQYKEPIGLCRSAMQITLDMIIEGCVFSMLTGNPRASSADPQEEENEKRGLCNGPKSQKVLFELKNSTWLLPKVRFRWDSSPPPPPPKSALAFALIQKYDLAYYTELRNRMLEWYAPVEDVLTNNVPTNTITQEVWNMQRTRAISAIAHLDPNSIAARMIVSLFTMRWHIGCIKLKEEMDNPENARAGTSDGDFPYDRNILLYWAVIFFQSQSSVNPAEDLNPLVVYQTFCEVPCAWREAFPYFQDDSTSEYLYKQSPIRASDYSLDCSKFSPLVGYGSLRQLRDTSSAGYLSPDRHPEDMTLIPNVVGQDTGALRRLDNGFPYDYSQNVICDVADKHSTLSAERLNELRNAKCESMFSRAPEMSNAGVPGSTRTSPLVLQDRAHEKFSDFPAFIRAKLLFYDMKTRPNDEFKNPLNRPHNFEDDVFRSNSVHAWYYLTSTGLASVDTSEPPKASSDDVSFRSIPTAAVGKSPTDTITFSGTVRRFEMHAHACDNKPKQFADRKYVSEALAQPYPDVDNGGDAFSIQTTNSEQTKTQFRTVRELLKVAQICSRQMARSGIANPPPPPPSPRPSSPPMAPSPSPPPTPPPGGTLEQLAKLARDVEKNFCDTIYDAPMGARCATLGFAMYDQFFIDPEPPSFYRPPAPTPPSPFMPSDIENTANFIVPPCVITQDLFELNTEDDASDNNMQAYLSSITLLRPFPPLPPMPPPIPPSNPRRRRRLHHRLHHRPRRYRLRYNHHHPNRHQHSYSQRRD